jgi:hypothetical protein
MPSPIAKTLVLLGSLALPGVALADRVEAPESTPRSPPALAPEGVFHLLLVAPGAANKTGAATAVHCTNLAASNTFLMVQIHNWDAAIVCTINSAAIPPLATWTAATQDVSIFFEDEVCDAPGIIEQGLVRVLVAAGSPADVACTVQVIDPAAATAYATTLEVYPR